MVIYTRYMFENFTRISCMIIFIISITSRVSIYIYVYANKKTAPARVDRIYIWRAFLNPDNHIQHS